MKLHLPKALLTAVLAVCVAQDALAKIEIVEPTETQNGTYTVTGSGVQNVLDNSITFQNSDVNVWDYNYYFLIENKEKETGRDFFNKDATVTGSVQIGNLGDTADDTVGLVINNGNSGAGAGIDVEFTGTVTGTGIIRRTGPSTNATTYITFSGDMTGYKGNIYLGAASGNTFTFTLGSKTDAKAAAATTSTKGIAGTGNIQIATANSKLVFNYAKGTTPVYITNVISEAGTINGSTVTMKGGADYIFVKDVTIDNINLESSKLSLGTYSDTGIAGSLTITGSLGMQKGASIDFTSGVHNIAKLDIHNYNKVNSTETITIAGATVKITGGDNIDNNGVEDIYGGTTGAAAVTIGHWNNGGGKIVVGGKTASASLFDVSGATIRMSWDSNSVLEINENGTVNAKRIQFANNDDNAVLTLAGGRLNLGEGGISANSTRNNGSYKREINLNSGTLGALAGSVDIAAGTTNIGGAITIDTAIVDAEGEKTGETASISFSNNVVLSDDAAFTIKGGGSVSINALAIKNTLKFDVQEATKLNVGNVSLSLQDGAIALDTANVYTDNSEGTISAANGFAKSAYQLFDGYEWSGSETIDTYSVVTQGGDTFLLSDNSDVGTIYYVNKGTHTISTASDYIDRRALGYSVAKNAGLVIDGASTNLSAADLLTGTEGEGNITVKTNISLSNGAKSKATGKLTVEGVSLSMGGDKDHNINLSSFSSVDLNGATLIYHGADTTFKNVTVGATGATISIKDMNGQDGNCDVMTLAGTTTLNGLLTIKSAEWKYTVNIEALTGSGNLDISSSAIRDDFAIVNVGLAGYTGAITVTKNTGTATLNATSAGVVNLTGITLKNGATGTFAVSANANLGDVNIGTGSLSISNTGTTTATTTLKTLQGSGSLSFTGNEAERTLSISSLQGYAGSLTVTKGTGATSLEVTTGGAAALTGLTLENGANMTLNGGNLTVGGNLKMSLASGITLDKDATIHLGSTVSVKGVSSEEGAKSQIVRREDGGDSPVKGDVYDTRNTEYSIKNAHVTVTSSSEINVSNKIDNSAITNNGTGTVNLVFGASDRTEVNALKGNINMMWMSSGNGRTDILTKLEVADNLTIAAQVANAAIADIEKENLSTLEVTKTAIIGSNATVKANLTLNNGASITLNGYSETAATITGTLELGTGLELSGNVVKAIEEMQVDDKLLLLKADAVVFGKLDDAAYGEYADLAVAAEAMVEATPLLESIVDARTYFSSLNVGDYQLLFEQGALYIQKTASIPEPTTATLSLLALAALASRRRRK